MGSPAEDSSRVELTVENVGGIDETTVEFGPGVTVLAGRNATNRTSLLRAIMAALGSEDVSLKADADRGRAELAMDGENHTRELRRVGGDVLADGDPFLEDPTVADLFAFLLESNEARRTVVLGGDLRDVIMRPVDLEAIEAEIERLQAERQDVDRELDELKAEESRLPALEERRTALEREVEEKREALAEKEAELESMNAAVQANDGDGGEVEELLDELRDLRTRLEEVRFDGETQRESVESLRSERAEVEEERRELDELDSADVGDLEREIGRLRDRRADVESALSQLQTIVQFNEETLGGANAEVRQALRASERAPSEVVDGLVDGEDPVVCWTCGTEVSESTIEDTVALLRELRDEKRAERRSLNEEIDELGERKQAIEERRRTRDRLDRRLDRLDEEIADREERIEELEAREQDLESAVEELEDAVEDRRSGEFEDVLELQRTVNRLETELRRAERELDEVEAEVDRVESALESRAGLEARREELSGELTDLRTRVEDLERDAVEEFNEHMEEVLELLEYENVERVWIERLEAGGRGSGPRDAGAEFTLHVVRATADGGTFEDSFEHLSESERKVTGLVFALAGFLVHDVQSTVPFMVLDSLEAIDSGRIRALLEHFEEYASYLVVALLPEDASALPDDYRRIEDI